ncbi:MAG: energy transducer TonB [Spirochaetaceae bacterium]|nr:MAG: energy transducer TonB [Spirochaetaceae bacterium]
MMSGFRRGGQRRMLWAVVVSLAIHALLIFVVVSREPEPPAVARGHVLAATIVPGRAAVDGDGSGPAAVREVEDGEVGNVEPAPAVQQDTARERMATPDPEPDSREQEPADTRNYSGSDGSLSAAASGGGAASGSTDTPRSVAARVELPRPLERIVPEYPRIARRRGLEGEVVIQVTISAFGDPLAAEIISPSDHRVLNDAAIAAVQAARFQPGLVGDQPTEMSLSIRIVFELS